MIVWPFGLNEVRIADAVSFIAKATCSGDDETVAVKRVRERVRYHASKRTELVNRGFVSAIQFWRWAYIEWPELRGCSGFPEAFLPTERQEAGASMNATSQTFDLVIPNDLARAKSVLEEARLLIASLRKELVQTNGDLADCREQLQIVGSELSALRAKASRESQLKSAAGKKAKGIRKNKN